MAQGPFDFKLGPPRSNGGKSDKKKNKKKEKTKKTGLS